MRTGTFWILLCALISVTTIVAQEESHVGLRLIVVENEAEAEDILARLEAGEAFEGLARTHSIHPSASAGGYLANVVIPDLREEFHEALVDLVPGQISPIVKLAEEYVLLQLLTDEETLVKSIEHAAAWRNMAAFNDEVDWNAMMKRGLAGVTVPMEVQEGLLEIFPSRFMEQIVGAAGYKFLRVRARGAERWALFRMIWSDGTFTYHDMLLAEDANGKLRVIDVNALNTGVLFSESLRQVLPLLANESEELRELLTDSEREFVEHSSTMAQITQAGDRGDYRSVLQFYDDLPPSLRRHKNLLSLRLRAAQALGGEEYSRALTDYRAYYQDDPSLDFLLIDLYAITGEVDESLRALDRILIATGGDPYLNALKAAALLEGQDLDAAKQEAQSAIDGEPTLQIGYQVLLTIVVARNEFEEAVQLLDEMETRFGFELTDPPPEYSEFIDSPQYKVWLQR